MKSLLVPIDFSAASQNAVDYAVHWSQRYGYDQIILFKVHYESFMDFISTLGVGYSFMGKDASFNYRRESKALLKRLQKAARAQLDTESNIQVRTATSDLPLTRAIVEILSEEPTIELIALGSDHTRSNDPGFITANIIKIARISPVKVLIIPEGYAYKPVEKVLVPCDLKHMEQLSKLEKYKSMLDTHSQLTILNIYADPQQEQQDTIRQWKEKLHHYFEGKDLQLYDAYNKNTLNGVLDFVSQHDTDLIVALPGTHSFLYYMANKSLSEGIYKNTSQSVLLLK